MRVASLLLIVGSLLPVWGVESAATAPAAHPYLSAALGSPSSPPADLVALVAGGSTSAPAYVAPPVPASVAPPSVMAQLSTPDTATLQRVRALPELLVWSGSTEPSASENQALGSALRAFSSDHDPSSLTGFLASHPGSAWSGSLHLNLGLLWRHQGRFSLALSAWQQAWSELKGEVTGPARSAADRAAGELAQLYVWIGRHDALVALLAEARSRPGRTIDGGRLEAAGSSLGFQESHPAQTYTCGPFGLETIGNLTGLSGPYHTATSTFPATAQGTNLSQLAGLARQIGLGHVALKRAKGTAIPTPALVHWSVGHYSVVAGHAGGRYRIVDQTFDPFQGRELWMDESVLDEEASGYFLAPVAARGRAGWSEVGAAEGEQVWGRGAPNQSDNDGAANEGANCPECPRPPDPGMPEWTFKPSNLALILFDTPLAYTPPKGPGFSFQLTYNSTEPHQPAIFPYGNVGFGWTHNWLSFIEDDPTANSNGPGNFPRQSMPGGGYVYVEAKAYVMGSNIPAAWGTPDPRKQFQLRRTGDASYEITSPSRMTYTYASSDGATSNPRRIFLTQVRDANGNTVQLSYDPVTPGKLRFVQDSLNRTITFDYTNADPLKLTRVTDPFGRHTDITYDGNGLLSSITDVQGLSSSVGYVPSSTKVSSLTTPYGTTTFVHSAVGLDQGRSIEATDPQGDRLRVEYSTSQSFPDTVMPSGMLSGGLYFPNYFNTYFWDRKAMKLYPNDSSKAVVYRFAASASHTVGIPVIAVKRPGENAVWMNYAGQATINSVEGLPVWKPSSIGRVLDDGSSSVTTIAYNAIGLPTQTVDPLGRTITNTYAANGLDLLEVRNTTGGRNELLASFTYDGNGNPLTFTDANGQTTTYTWNSAGQPLSITPPIRAGQPAEPVQFIYSADGKGYLTRIRDPSGSDVVLGYDGFDRVSTVTDPEGYAVSQTYDNLNRPLQVTYPDGTTEQVLWNRLDAEWVKDREGRWTRTWYNALRQVMASRDPAGRVTAFTWCKCGALASLYDPQGRITTWNYDVAGRLTSKVYPDGRSTSYGYQLLSGRLGSVTDAKGQVTSFTYNRDGTIAQVAYTNATVATAGVSFTYDPAYQRILSLVDGTGTTTYGYNPIASAKPVPAITGAGALASIDGPLTNDTGTFGYDEFGRGTSANIAGQVSSVILDRLGRTQSATDPLGTFGYSYVGNTGRVSTISAPNGMSTILSYQALANDFRLLGIRHQTSGGARISEFGYTSSASGRIGTWTQQVDTSTPTVWSFGYDPADQLTDATATSGTVGGALIRSQSQRYDPSGNRINGSENTPGLIQQASGSYNEVNQLTAYRGSGSVRIQGHVNEPASVQVNGQPAVVNPDQTFAAWVPATTGTNTFSVAATDLSGNTKTSSFQMTVAAGLAVDRFPTYDANGNCLTDGVNTYTWDAADRLVQIDTGTGSGAKRSVFTYDGLGRRVRITESAGSPLVVTTDRTYLWLGATIVEERNASTNATTKRYLANGVQIIGGSTAGNYFYTRDHLGSIRELVTTTGTVAARWDYDPWGKRTTITGTAYDAEFLPAYTGHFRHQGTGVYLTWFRAYDPRVGRWLSRDPIEEGGGINLYAYVGGNPTGNIDQFGLIESPKLPNGEPAPPPIPLPPGKNGQPNTWKPIPGSGARPIKWIPKFPIVSPTGGQPSASWDPDGHWDTDNGNGTRGHFDPTGRPISPEEAHPGNPGKCPPKAPPPITSSGPSLYDDYRDEYNGNPFARALVYTGSAGLAVAGGWIVAIGRGGYWVWVTVAY